MSTIEEKAKNQSTHQHINNPSIGETFSTSKTIPKLVQGQTNAKYVIIAL